MIFNEIIKLGFGFVNGIIDNLNLEALSFDTGLLSSFLDVLNNVAYFFPWPYIWPIFAFMIGIQGYRILISLIKLITSLIPLY